MKNHHFNNIYNIKIIPKHSNYCPKQLYNLYDCPEILFVLGNEKILNSFSVAIVGTRNSSLLGNTIANNISKKLSENGIIIVSGLASGIDTEAHKGTFSTGKTIAIVACGFNYLLHSSKSNLIKEILNNDGAIITEYFPDISPQKFSFLKRNRLVAALSSALIVVEAPLKSGALNTAKNAITLKKPLFVVPWNLDTYKGAGCNNLLENGAIILTNHKQILNYFYPKTNILFTQDKKYLNSKVSTEQKTKIPLNIPKDQIKLYNYIKTNQPVSKIDICTKFSTENISKINSNLTLLEIENLIILNRYSLLYKNIKFIFCSF